MRVGAFELQEPLPELHDVHVISSLRPWLDAGNVGTVVLSRLERHFSAKELGKLARPGVFFDFTRYRPMTRMVGGRRTSTVPNTTIHVAEHLEHRGRFTRFARVDDRPEGWVAVHKLGGQSDGFGAIEPHLRPWCSDWPIWRISRAAGARVKRSTRTARTERRLVCGLGSNRRSR